MFQSNPMYHVTIKLGQIAANYFKEKRKKCPKCLMILSAGTKNNSVPS